MKKVLVTIAWVLILSGMAQAETIRIGGSGSMIPLLTELGNAYMKKHPGDRVEVNQKSLGQQGGILALNSGAIEIAMSGMDLSAEQKKLPVTAIEIAHVPGVIAVSANVTAANLTSRQLCDIYEGKIRNWKQVGGSDAPITVLTRPESDSTKTNFRRAFACMKGLQEGPDVLSLPKSSDAFNAMETKPNSICPVDVIALTRSAGKFKAIKIDGKDHEATASGNWPFYLDNTLVIKNNPSESIKRFLQFIKSPAGQSIIKKGKAIPKPFSI